MTAALLKPKSGDWVVYQVNTTKTWAGSVKFGERINGHDSLSVYDFETRTEAVDWCLDMVAMREALEAWRQAA